MEYTHVAVYTFPKCQILKSFLFNPMKWVLIFTALQSQKDIFQNKCYFLVKSLQNISACWMLYLQQVIVLSVSQTTKRSGNIYSIYI